jgi:5'-methylthioadenosine phosphorylase
MHESRMNNAFGVIGGSGLYEMEGIEGVTRRSISTPFGNPSDEIIEGTLSGKRVCFLPRHGTGHRLLAHEINHRANIWAMRSLGVRWLVSVTAVGSLREELPPRMLVVPDQLVDRTGRFSESTFFGEGIAAHVGFADPYSAGMRRLLWQAATGLTANARDGGTYVCMNGPAFSTRAEAKLHRDLGFDIIGMTNAPEAKLCREAEIAAATLACVTDYDCWKTDEEPVTASTVIGHLKANSELAKNIIRAVAALIPATPEWPEHRALDQALLTPRTLWPDQKIRQLAPILERFADA